MISSMDAFVSRKRRLSSSEGDDKSPGTVPNVPFLSEEESTEWKLAMLASLHPSVGQATLLDILLSNDGSVEDASQALLIPAASTSKKSQITASLTYQSSLSLHLHQTQNDEESYFKRLTKKGRTLHLFSPEDIAKHTPCSIMHNFLPPVVANDLLRELLQESTTFGRQTFRMFDNVVQSPHTACFYVQTLEDERKQKHEYMYNGSYLSVSGRARHRTGLGTETTIRTSAKSNHICVKFRQRSKKLSIEKLLSESRRITRMARS